MKVVKLETFLTHCGLRDFLFVRLTTASHAGLGQQPQARIAVATEHG